MANEFIIRKGYKSLASSEVTGSLTLIGDYEAIRALTINSTKGSGTEHYFRTHGVNGDTLAIYSGGSRVLSIDSNSIDVLGSISGSTYYGDGSNLTGVLTSTPTLDQVTDQGATTTNAISTGTITANGSILGGGNLFLRSYNTDPKGIFFRDGFEYGDTNQYNLSITVFDDGDSSADAMNINAYDGIYFNVQSGTTPSTAFKVLNSEIRAYANLITTGDLIVSGSHITANVGTGGTPQSTDYLYIGGDNLASADGAIYIGNRGDGTGYGYRIYYSGVGSGNNNKLILKSENLGSTVDMLTFTADGAATFANDVVVAGTLTAQEFHTEYVSASIVHQSGSTKFGDTSDDNHDFTGSINLTGSMEIQQTVDGSGLVIRSSNVKPEIRFIDDSGTSQVFGLGYNRAGNHLVIDFGNASRVEIAEGGQMTLNTINQAASDTDKFLVSDSGAIKFRSGSQVLSDIGAAASSHTHAATDITSGTLNNARLDAKVFVNDGGTFSDGFASDVDDVVGFRTLRVTGFTGTDHRAFTDHHNMITIPNTSSTQYDAQLAFQTGTVSQGGLKYRSSTNGTWSDWYKIWHEGNDGPTSGLSAQTAGTASYVLGSNVNGTVASATSASHAGSAPYSGLYGTVPTWNQDTTGTAATASYVAASNIDGSVNADTLDSINSTQFLRSDAADTASQLITFQKGISQDGNAKFYTWRALNNTASTSNQYFRIARITSTQSSRFAIEIAGRSTSYSNPVIPAIGVIVGQLNNDNNYDIVFYNHSTGTSQVVSEVGQVDVDTVSTDIYIKAGQFAELSATGHISDGSITTYGGDSASATAPTNYVAATEVIVWNSGNDGPTSGLAAQTAATASYLDGSVASASYANNADTLDGLDSGAFLRSNADDTATGQIDFHRNDTQNIIITGNSSASNANQFFLKHNFGNVDLGNLRGNLNLTSGSVNITNTLTVSGDINANGGISGLTLANGGISGTNFNITGVNQLEIADPGEGIVFKSGASGDMTLAIVDDSTDNILRFSGTGAQLQVGTNRVLTTADEGSGNGLDADTLDGNHASAFLTSLPSHTHDDRYYTETETNEGLAALRGWVPGYSNGDESSVKWNFTEDAVEIQSSTDTSTGIVYQARRIVTGETVRFTVMVKGSAASSNGLYLRLYQYDGDMPDGKTHVSNDAIFSLVQEDSRGDTGWYENGAITTGWVTFEREYTAPTSGYVSLVVLNWTSIGNNSVYLKTPDIQTVKAGDTNKFDGLDSTQFLRSDTNDSTTGILTFAAGSTGTLASRTGFTDFLGYNASYGSYIGGGVSNASSKYLYAGGFINDGTGVKTLWHSGNDGASSGLDADTLDTYHASSFIRKGEDVDTTLGNSTDNRAKVLTLNYSHTNTFAAASDIGDTNRVLTIQNPNGAATDGLYTALHMQVLGNAGTTRAMGDIKFVRESGYKGSWYFTSKDTAGSWRDGLKISTDGITVEGSGSTVFDVQGSQGQLFSITDDLTGDIFSVSDISGIPILNVNASGDSYFDGNLGIGTTTLAANATATVSGSMTFGIPGNGSNVNGRFISIEGNTDASGEGSGRIFFTEHNSTTAAMDNYGMSIGYRGGGTTITTAGGNSWTGLTGIGNGEWGMWGHDNSLAGALIMSGDRAATYIDFEGNILRGIGSLQSTSTINFLNGSSAQTAKFKSIQVSTSYSGTIPDNGILFSTDTNLYRSAANTLKTDDNFEVAGTFTPLANVAVGGGITINGSISSGATDYGYYQSAGTNLILKGDSSGRSGIFFESEKDGTNINDPSDYGFIQFHAYGYGGSSGEANVLAIGVANDSTDTVVLQSPYNGGVKVGYRDATSGTGLTLATVFHDNYHPNADTLTTARSINGTNFNGSGNITTANWGTARTITIGNTGKSVNGSGNYSWTIGEIGAAYYDHFRSLGVPAFTTGTTTTAGIIAEMEGDGAFDSYTSAFKTSWSYAGNIDITDGGTYGPTETAGMSFLTWTDNSSDSTRGNITFLAIAPNTGGSAGRTFIYNDQGSAYSPGWREVWTSRRMGSGTNLDADKLDGQEGSFYQNASNLNAGTFPDLFSNSTRYNIGFIDGSSSQNRDKIRVWGSGPYAIGMKNGYDFGYLGSGEYAMSFQMNNTSGRGFWWGDDGHTDDQGAMSLTTDGRLMVATRISVGNGESATGPNSTATLSIENGGSGGNIRWNNTYAAFNLGLYYGLPYIASENSGNNITGLQVGNPVSGQNNFYVVRGSAGIGVSPSTTIGRLDCSNDIVAYSSSDIRWKENIKTIENPIDKVKAIGGYEFDWKELTDEETTTQHSNKGHDIGVIAQEIEEVLPEVVTTRENGYKGVRYEKITPLLIEAIKEQQKQIEELKAIVDKLQSDK